MESIYEKRPWLKQYLPDVPHDIEIPEDKSVPQIFDEITNRWKNKTALIFYGQKISFGELRERVDRFATALAEIGVKKGDRVALLLLNSPEYVVSFFAVTKIGGVITPVSPVYVSSEIKHQLADADVETVICQDILYDALASTDLNFKHVILTNISESLPRLKKVIGKSILRGVYQTMHAPEPEIIKKQGLLWLKDLVKDHKPEPPEVKINPKEDLFMLPYTGGTTGPPKGAMITHYNMVANFFQGELAQNKLEDGKEVVIAFAPFYHAAGTYLMYAGLFRGHTLVILTTPDLDFIVENAVKYGATYFTSAPTLFQLLNTFEKTDRINWKKVKLNTCGSDTLHEKTALEWQGRTNTAITEYYGMTETVCLTHGNPIGKERHTSIGVPITSTWSAILDPDEDKYTPVGEIGEIVVEGPQITIGYWKRPDVTKECEAIINGRRWWRTGDLGRMDEDGFFYVYDRKRDLIKYKGLRVFAREVEEALKLHPKIKEVGVVGEPDPLVGENIKAVIVLESDARGKLSERDITEYCQDKLAHYKIPKIIEFVGEIPKTDIGKVSRREIRTQEE